VELDAARRGALGLLQEVERARQLAVEAEQATRDQAARTQAILDGATDAIITINAEGVIEAFNAAAEQMFGHRAEDVIGYNVNMLMPSPYQEEHDQHIQNYLNTGVSRIIGVRREVVGLRADGSTFPMDISVSEVKLGDRRMFTGIIRDISELKQALDQLGNAHLELTKRARQIERFNADLRRSNDELKQFAYVASHDLQEPLRKVTAFCQMLASEYSDRLYAVDGATRMKSLVQDLLTYSRVETQGKPLEPTNANDTCAAAMDNLAAAIEESAARVTIDSLPVVQADRSQLVRLFQNLIGNAIKYRGAETPRIHVSALEADSEWVFRVRDNGIGIAPQYHARIFVIFQRLHARDEYSGTGIGLAVCKRIVERFGGRIWVESQEGAGSEFCFALPKSAATPTSSQEGDSTYGRDIRQVVSAID
jgi:PAS domain S-box-containing protein